MLHITRSYLNYDVIEENIGSNDVVRVIITPVENEEFCFYSYDYTVEDPELPILRLPLRFKDDKELLSRFLDVNEYEEDKVTIEYFDMDKALVDKNKIKKEYPFIDLTTLTIDEIRKQKIKVEDFIIQNVDSVNTKIELMNNPDNFEVGHYGKNELNIQLATALYYINKIEDNSFENIDKFDLIYDDSTVNSLLNKYKIELDFDSNYSYDLNMNKIVITKEEKEKIATVENSDYTTIHIEDDEIPF